MCTQTLVLQSALWRQLRGAPGTQIHKVKSHRALSEATNLHDLYTILGNMVADETAKLVNKQDISPMEEAATSTRKHCMIQSQALEVLFSYLIELNAFHVSLKHENDQKEAAEAEQAGVDAFSSFQEKLVQWAFETLYGHLPVIYRSRAPRVPRLPYALGNFFRPYRGDALIYHFRRMIMASHVV